jgi:4'-phosphopantetheinyl transferase
MSGAPDLAWARVSATPRDVEWLTAAERTRLASFRVPKRQADWTAGRIAAKRVAARRHFDQPQSLALLEIQAAAEGLERGKPRYCVGGEPGDFDLSIAHTDGIAVAALAPQRDQRVGIDLERIEQRDGDFEAIALAPSELAALHALAGDERALAVTRLWVRKEALLKAVGVGLRVPLAGIAVRHPGAQVIAPAAEVFSISETIRGAHPLFARFETLRISLEEFRIEGIVGVWLLLNP